MAYAYPAVLGLTLGMLCHEQRDVPNDAREWLIDQIRQSLKTAGGTVPVANLEPASHTSE